MQIDRRQAMVALAAAVVAGGTARAHDSENGPNGGQMIEVKGHHLGMTAKDDEIRFFLTDASHAPTASKGASGRVVILEGAKQSQVALTPADPNLLVARLEAPLVAGARVVVSAKLGDGHDILARFVLK